MTSETTIDLQIGGMSSRDSAASLERVLGALPGVQRAIVSYGTRRCRVVLANGAPEPDLEARVMAVIEAQGFSAMAIGGPTH